MITTLLDKLTEQIRHSVATQNEGDIAAAFDGYSQVFETLWFYDELGYQAEVEEIQRLVLEAQPTPAMALLFHGLLLQSRRRYASAVDAMEAALHLMPDMLIVQVKLVQARLDLGDFDGARLLYEQIKRCNHNADIVNDQYYSLAVAREMPGEDYYFWLQHFHEQLQPATYVEIGLGHGRSLALAGPGTRAIGIDPYQGSWDQLNFVSPHGPATLYRVESDNFFAHNDLREVIGKETFDLAFIDGLHIFEQVLRDFVNLERYAGAASVILIHDGLPVTPLVAERKRCTGFWTGDVWRIIPCLKTFRPDLKISTIPAKPSGLTVVTNLDPASRVLAENYDDIVDYYTTLRLPESFAERSIVCNVIPNTDNLSETMAALLQA